MYAYPEVPSSWNLLIDPIDIYGLIYNHAALGDPRMLCPTDWSVASNADFDYVCGWYADQSGNLYTNGVAVDGSGGWNYGWGYGEDEGYVPPCATNFSGLDLRPGGYGASGSFPHFYAIGYNGTYWRHEVTYSNFEEGDRFVTQFRISGSCGWCPGEDLVHSPWSGAYVRCIKD